MAIVLVIGLALAVAIHAVAQLEAWAAANSLTRANLFERLGLQLTITLFLSIPLTAWVSALANLFQKVAGSRPAPRRVLLLRRFHKETNDAFRLTLVFDALGKRGHSVVTLADSVVRNRESKASLDRAIAQGFVRAAIYGPAILVGFGAFFAVWIFFLGWTSSLSSGDEAWKRLLSSEWIPLAALLLSAVPLVFAIQYILGVLGKYVDRLDVLVTGIAGRPRAWPGDAIRVWRLAASNGGMLVVSANDRDWEAYVGALVESADIICFDADLPSPSIEIEKELFRRLARGKALIFRCDAQSQSRSFGVMACPPHSLSGWEGIANAILVYPKQRVPSSWYDETLEQEVVAHSS